MRVKLLTYTPEPEKLVATAARLCYANTVNIETLMDNLTWEKVNALVEDLAESGHACYDDKTEVLTKDGFKYWKNVTEEDKIAVFNPKNCEFVKFERPLKLHDYIVENEELVSFKTADVDLLVTKNHKIYCSINNTPEARNNPTFELRSCDEVVQTIQHFNCKELWQKPMRMTKMALNPNHSNLEKDKIFELYGFFIGDGYADSCNRISFSLKKERKINYLKNLCKNLGEGFVFESLANDKYVVRYENIGNDFRKMFYNKKNEKCFPKEFFNMTVEQFEYFKNGLLNSDGSKKRNTYVYITTSCELANNLQGLFSINGTACSLRINKKKNGNSKPVYVLNLNSRRNLPFVNDSHNKKTTELKLYTGHVYCATTSTGLMMVRRNNRVVLCGNSPFTQVYFTFAIEGVSRAFSHQFCRHHIGITMDQRSQRYVNEENFQYIIPKAIANSDMASEYESFMQNIAGFYKRLLNAGFKKEDARSVLPNACETKLITTINAQELFHIFNLRCCNRAQYEFRMVANEMLKLCKEVAPVIFKNAGASCISLGYCPEGKMSCGKAPTLKEVMEVYNGQNS